MDDLRDSLFTERDYVLRIPVWLEKELRIGSQRFGPVSAELQRIKQVQTRADAEPVGEAESVMSQGDSL